MNYQKNQILTVDIVDLNMMGFGVAKCDGAVFFVQNGVVGDRAVIRIIKCAKNYYVSRIEELLISSPHRREPKCSSFRRCGGCTFQHIDYDFEKEIKRRYVTSCFAKAGLPDVEISRVLSTNILEAYRNKAQFPVASDENGNVFFGFYSPKTHSVVATNDCSIQDPIFVSIAKFLCDFFNRNKIRAYSETTREGLVRHIYLRCGKTTGEVMLCLVLKEDAFPEEKQLVSELTERFPKIVSIHFNINADETNVILGKCSRLVYGKEMISDILCDRKLFLSPHSFYQVNHDAAELLYQTAFEMAKISEYDLIVDLYCGVGSISLATKANCNIIGVEVVPEAVEDARLNAKNNGVQNASYYCGDAAEAFRLIHEIHARNPLVIVDPPRKGLNEKLIRELGEHKIPKILYISCGSDTLARDCKRFSEMGYQISPITLVDLFPRTSHVETVVLLSREGIHERIKFDVNVEDLIK